MDSPVFGAPVQHHSLPPHQREGHYGSVASPSVGVVLEVRGLVEPCFFLFFLLVFRCVFKVVDDFVPEAHCVVSLFISEGVEEAVAIACHLFQLERSVEMLLRCCFGLGKGTYWFVCVVRFWGIRSLNLQESILISFLNLYTRYARPGCSGQRLVEVGCCRSKTRRLTPTRLLDVVAASSPCSSASLLGSLHVHALEDPMVSLFHSLHIHGRMALTGS